MSECAEFNFHADPEAAHAVLSLTRFDHIILLLYIIVIYLIPDPEAAHAVLKYLVVPKHSLVWLKLLQI